MVAGLIDVIKHLTVSLERWPIKDEESPFPWRKADHVQHLPIVYHYLHDQVKVEYKYFIQHGAAKKFIGKILDSHIWQSTSLLFST